MRIAIASDHAGFNLKSKIKSHLESRGRTVFDLGALNDKPSDYPDYAKILARKIADGEFERGALVCGSGIGMCISANRFAGVRAALVRSASDAELSRKHNDANVICLGARATNESDAIKFVDIFLSTEFEGGRHTARVKKIDEK